MLILTTDNTTFELDNIPEEEPETGYPDYIKDLRYCVFDSTPSDVKDYFFMPLVFMESWHSPAALLEIGDYKIQMPLDWSIAVCDEDYSSLELVPITKLNDRGFHTLVYNPMRHMVPKPCEINITNVYGDVKWFLPRVSPGSFLIVPLTAGENPPCALFIKDAIKVPDQIDIAELFE